MNLADNAIRLIRIIEASVPLGSISEGQACSIPVFDLLTCIIIVQNAKMKGMTKGVNRGSGRITARCNLMVAGPRKGLVRFS